MDERAKVTSKGQVTIPKRVRDALELREGDELHILVRGELRDEVEALTKLWHEGPVGVQPPPRLPRRGASQVFSVGPPTATDDPSSPSEVEGIPVVATVRSRRDRSSSLVALADGRYAVTSETIVAVGGRQALARWCETRAERSGNDATERAWWQEAIGALIARG
jgi:AbrB family looped-hinge helix DNA binding protein